MHVLQNINILHVAKVQRLQTFLIFEIEKTSILMGQLMHLDQLCSQFQ